MPLRLPPLRERSEDIPDLVRHFFNRNVAEGLAQKSLESAALDRLKRYSWPGNIRELENLTRRLAALYPQEVITEQIVEQELSLAAPLTSSASREAATLSLGPVNHERGAGNEQFAAGLDRHVAELFKAFGDNLPPAGLYHRVLRDLEAPLIAATLAATRGNQIRAAEVLGLNRNTLRKRLSDLGIDRAKPTR